MPDITIEGDGTEIRNCKFAFKCPKFWAELAETEVPTIRYCDHCEQKVYRCTTNNQIAIAIRHNRCVAIMSEYKHSHVPSTGLVGLLVRE